MTAKKYISKQIFDKPSYTPEQIQSLLNEALRAVAYWRAESEELDNQVARLVAENRTLRKQIAIFEKTPAGSVRLPVGGVVR